MPAQPFVASHPVYDYFARRYGLNIQSVLWEPEEFPSIEQWARLEGLLRAHPAKWMIWEGAPRPDAVQRLQAMGIGSVVFDTCGNVPEGGDFMTIMRANVGNLRRAFE